MLGNVYSYPEASEEDLKKWERSYRKLSPAHKVIFVAWFLALSNLIRLLERIVACSIMWFAIVASRGKVKFFFSFLFSSLFI